MSRLQAFAAELLQRKGALVEPVEPEGIDVVAPASVQQALGIGDLCRLGFGIRMPAGAQSAGIETEWLDRFARLIGEQGRYAVRVLRPANPAPSGIERLLDHELSLPNATYRLRSVTEAWTRYLIFDFRYTAFSDEKREGLLKLGVNTATGSVLDGVLERLLARLETEAGESALPEGIDLPVCWERRRVLDLVRRSVPVRLAAQIDPFTKSLARRLTRDEARLYSYHNRLFQDAELRIAAVAEDDARRRREQQRVEAIEREYRARVEDVRRKYALRITAEWTQTLELVMPVQRLGLLLRRRKGERLLQLDWNPLARRLEALPCVFGNGAERDRLVCDDALHLVASSGLSPCGGCGKPYCRACHAESCPKCGAAEAHSDGVVLRDV